MTTTTSTVDRATLRTELARIHGIAECGAEQLIVEALLKETPPHEERHPYDSFAYDEELWDLDDEFEPQLDPYSCDEFDEDRIARVLLFAQLDRDRAERRAARSVHEATGAVKVWAYNAFVAGLGLQEVALLSGLGVDDLADCELKAHARAVSRADTPQARIYSQPERRARIRKRLADEADRVVIGALLDGADIATVAALTRRTTCQVRAIAARV